MPAVLPPNLENWPTAWREEFEETLSLIARVCGPDDWNARELRLIAEAATRRKYRLERRAEIAVAQARADAETDAVTLATVGAFVVH